MKTIITTLHVPKPKKEFTKRVMPKHSFDANLMELGWKKKIQ